MSNKPDRPKPRVIDLKPKPKPRMASALDRGSEPRAGGRIDTPAERRALSWVQTPVMSLFRAINNNRMLAIFILTCAGALVFIACISYCGGAKP